MLKVVNVLLLLALIIVSVFLIGQRYKTRMLYTKLDKLHQQQNLLNDEYTKLQLEYGTYNSDYLMSRFSQQNMELVPLRKNNIIFIKN